MKNPEFLMFSEANLEVVKQIQVQRVQGDLTGTGPGIFVPSVLNNFAL
jgi:hypothetical protein